MRRWRVNMATPPGSGSNALPLELLFFFSSRGRHTRLTCDWSSDVCSSDLAVARGPARAGGVDDAGPSGASSDGAAAAGGSAIVGETDDGSTTVAGPRSEERRVGIAGENLLQPRRSDEEVAR